MWIFGTASGRTPATNRKNTLDKNADIGILNMVKEHL